MGGCAGRRRGRQGFNPRPAPKSGAIPQAAAEGSPPARFNPRPAPKSGAMRRRCRRATLCCVSIRAPLRRAGRFGAAIGVKRQPCFNPRPAPKSGAISRRDPSGSGIRRFQSAPRSEERGDRRARRCGPPAGCFNPRPAPKSGAIPDKARFRAPVVFQSAPRSEERGDKSACSTSSTFRLFQSAPRSEERGDQTSIEKGKMIHVSIRAPLRRAGRSFEVSGGKVLRNVSIRAPLRRAGRFGPA